MRHRANPRFWLCYRQLPDEVQRLTNLYVESMRYFQQNRDQMLKVISQKTQISEKALNEALKVVGYPDPPFVHAESLRVFTKELIEAQKIEANKVPDVEKFLAEVYNDKFIKAAVKG